MTTQQARCIFTAALMAALTWALPTEAACDFSIPLTKQAPQDDPLARIFAAQPSCAKNAPDFVGALKKDGVRLQPTMVNFTGFHNGDQGAFFIFEIASREGGPFPIQRGDLVFGHFTEATNDNRLVSIDSDLIVEVIAWDPVKQFYNFYDLVNGDWFYRGDSKDILDNIQGLWRDRTAANPFVPKGPRCAGCHVNGGLIQKELAPPHNDWDVR